MLSFITKDLTKLKQRLAREQSLAPAESQQNVLVSPSSRRSSGGMLANGVCSALPGAINQGGFDNLESKSLLRTSPASPTHRRCQSLPSLVTSERWPVPGPQDLGQLPPGSPGPGPGTDWPPWLTSSWAKPEGFY